MKYLKIIKGIALTALLAPSLFILQAKAQVVPLASQYYFNRYLGNPAFAGSEQGFKVNLAYRSQFNSIQGSPVTSALTGEYGFDNRVGLGLIVFSDKAGLLRRTKAVGTFAYHLPISENQTIHFGLSGGITTERLNTADLIGDLSDPSIARLNNNNASVDGDFGIAYTDNNWTIQGTLPNMRQLFKKDVSNTVNWAVFYAAISYKLPLGHEANTFEPLIAIRGVKGNDQIFDVGANLALNDDQFYVNALYHTSKNATLGLGFNIKQINTAILAHYTLNTASVGGAGNNNIFQIGLKLDLTSQK